MVLAGLLLPVEVGAHPQAAGGGGPGEQSSDPWALDWLDDQAAELVERGVTPGLVTVFELNGRIVSRAEYGVADIESGEPMSVDRTRFPLGSFTKVLTAMAVLQLMQEGRVSLTDPVDGYLDFRAPWKKRAAPITLGDLLTHTAGFSVQNIGIAKHAGEPAPSLRDYVRTGAPPRVREPGQLFSYSNYGYALAGFVVARAAEEPYEQYVIDHLLRPLGVSGHGSFDIDPARPDLARPHYCTRGECREIPVALGPAAPASGLVGSAEEVAHLVMALLASDPIGGHMVIHPDAARRIVERQFTPSLQPRPDGPTFGMFQYSDDGIRVAVAPGWMGGYTTKVIVYPDEGAGFVLLANSTNLEGLAHRLRNEIRRRRPCRSPTSTAGRTCGEPGQPAVAAEHPEIIGRYREMLFEDQGLARFGNLLMAGEMEVFASKGGALELQLQRDVYGLRSVAPNLFAVPHKPADMYFSFLDLDGDGSVDHASVHDLSFERIARWESPAIQQDFVTTLAVLAASFLLVWPVAAVRRQRRLSSILRTPPRQDPFGPRTSALLLGLACVALLVSLAGVAFWTSEPRSTLLAFGHPLTLQISRWVAFSLILLVPWLLVSVARAWRVGYWSQPLRVHFSIVTLAVAAYLAYAGYSGIIPG